MQAGSGRGSVDDQRFERPLHLGHRLVAVCTMHDQQPIIDGRVTTRFLDENAAPDEGPTRKDREEDANDDARAAAVDQIGRAAGRAWFDAIDALTPTTSPWIGSTFSVTPRPGFRSVYLDNVMRPGGTTLGHSVDIEAMPTLPAAVDVQARRVAVNDRGYTHNFTVPTLTEKFAGEKASRPGSGDAIVAPFPAVVSEVSVVSGDRVEGDQVLVVIEAMKMLHSLRATGASTIDQVRVSPGDQVATGEVLVTFVASETETPT